MNGIFITGTDTNVGKTWVGSHLLLKLYEDNISLAVRKPIESGWDENNIESTDAHILAKAANQLDKLNLVCPNRFSRPISPARAAKLEGKKLLLERVKEQCIKNVKKNDFLYVEGAGGFYSPLCQDGLNADLVSALGLPVLLVAENRLGCINQVLLNIEAIRKRDIELKALILNAISGDNESYDMNNAEDLEELLDCPVFCTNVNENMEQVFKDLADLLVVAV